MQYSILDFGAVADGETLCTEAINKTIRSVAEAGGGYAIVPAGRFLTGSIRILSNVHLVLEPGSVLLGTLDTNLIEPLTEKEGSRPLISAVGQHDVGIIGAGTVDLQRRGTHRKYGMPMCVEFFECTRVTMRGITLTNPGFFTSFTRRCTDVNYDRINIDTMDCDNGDGLDFEGCWNVTISNCILRCGDDAIGLKTYSKQYPCENFTITNCVIHSNWAAIRLGPESGGDMRNITVSNCVFNDCSDGLKVQVWNAGTAFEDLTFSNINMVNVKRPFFFTNSEHSMTGREEEAGIPTSVIRRVQIDNVNAGTIQTEHDWFEEMCVFVGCPGQWIEDLTIANLYVRSRGFGKREWAENMEVPSFIEYIPRYPDVVWHHWTSACLFLRYAKRVKLYNCVFAPTNPDARPAVEAEVVDGFKMSQTEQRNCGALLQYHRVDNMRLSNCDGEVKALTPELEARWEKYYAAMLKLQGETINTAILSDYLRRGTVIAEFPMPASEEERGALAFSYSYEGGRVYLRVDSFERSIRIFVNGKLAHDWYRMEGANSHSNYSADITDALVKGNNDIKVECYGDQFAKINCAAVKLIAPPDEPAPANLRKFD